MACMCGGCNSCLHAQGLLVRCGYGHYYDPDEVPDGECPGCVALDRSEHPADRWLEEKRDG